MGSVANGTLASPCLGNQYLNVAAANKDASMAETIRSRMRLPATSSGCQISTLRQLPKWHTVYLSISMGTVRHSRVFLAADLSSVGASCIVRATANVNRKLPSVASTAVK